MSNILTVQVETPEGVETKEVDLDLTKLTLRESVTLEEALGEERADALLAGKLPMRPSTIRALLYAKLKTSIPTLELESFDLDLDAIATLEP